MGQEEVEFYRRMGFNPATTVVAGPGGPYPMPKIETQESVNQRIRKLEEELAGQKEVTVGLRMILDATNRAMLNHAGKVEKNFEFLRVVGNDLHIWATRFLDEYNARHPAPPIMYPAALPPGFAFAPDEASASSKVNDERRELLNEYATLKREHDAIRKKYNDLVMSPPKYADPNKSVESLTSEMNHQAKMRAEAVKRCEELEIELAAAKAPKPPAKKKPVKKPASK